MSWKHTLKLEVYSHRNGEEPMLRKEIMTSPTKFFKDFQVHKSKMKVEIQGNSLFIYEVDNEKNVHYSARIQSSTHANAIQDSAIVALINEIKA